MYSSLIILLSFFITSSALSQSFSNHGLVSVHHNGLLSVKGDVQNNTNGLFDNDGEIDLTGNWTHVASNEAFVKQTDGEVILSGADQRIRGTSITRFYRLDLRGSGVKYADLDVYVDGYLNVFDREMFVDTNTIYLFNPDTNAVDEFVLNNQYGWVSSAQGGGLYRNTSWVGTYYFPIGGHISFNVFRPMEVTTTLAQTQSFLAHFNPDDPNLDGLDRSQTSYEICDVHPNFYYWLDATQTGADISVTVYFDPLIDGNYNGVGRWQNTEWIKPSFQDDIITTAYTLSGVRTSTAISNVLIGRYDLVKAAPNISVTAQPDPVCSNRPLLIQANHNGLDFDSYDYFVDGVLVHSGSYSQFTYDSFRVGTVPIFVVGNYADCGDVSDTTFVEVLQGVNGMISPDTIIIEGTIANLYASGGDFYQWIPDSFLSCAICPQTEAAPPSSQYYQLEIETLDACKDTLDVFVDVQPDVNSVLFIPNVITPNNDGYNDTWFIQNIGLFPSNSVIILNRWGDQVFVANNYQNNWDGRFGGADLPAGTYYYILDVGGSWGILKGDVTILRE